MNDPCIRLLRSVAAGSVAALLCGCGGGGGDAGWAPATPPVGAAEKTDDPAVSAPLVLLQAYGTAAEVRASTRGSNSLAVAGPPARLSQ